MNDLGNEENCILCDQGVKVDDQLNDIGSRWTLKDEEDKEKKSATLSESICVFNENESFCSLWRVPSINELFRFNRKGNGRK